MGGPRFGFILPITEGREVVSTFKSGRERGAEESSTGVPVGIFPAPFELLGGTSSA